MKFKVGDTVLVTAGKDKGKQGNITKILPAADRVVVSGANLYTKHIKPQQGRSGDKIRVERAMSPAKIAIINDAGKADRIGYAVAKNGEKNRVFKKTGSPVPEPKTEQKTK
ncbi:MAG: 50S ribosomal protein L24 [Patescibacteria group bacterium]